MSLTTREHRIHLFTYIFLLQLIDSQTLLFGLVITNRVKCVLLVMKTRSLKMVRCGRSSMALFIMTGLGLVI